MTEKILWELAGSLWMMICSAVTFNRIGEVSLSSLFVMPETLIYLIFGILHALLIFVSQEIVRNRFRLEEKLWEKLLSFVADSILYSSFYRLVLLPACGFGFIEWGILLLFFASEFGVHFHILRDKKDDVLGKMELVVLDEEQLFSSARGKFINPFQLSVMGLVLWGFKIIVRYALPQNLYYSLAGNKTVLNLVLLMFVMAGVYAIRRGIACIKNVGIKNAKNGKNKKSSKKGTAAKTAKKAFSLAAGFFEKVVSVIFTLVSGPGVVIVLVVILVFGGIGGFFFLNGIRNDLLEFLGSVLGRVLSTDNPGYTETNLNTLGQCVAIMIYFMVQIAQKYFAQKQLQSAVEERWLEAVEDFEKTDGENRELENQPKIEEIRKILRKEILRDDINSATKERSYNLLTSRMSDAERQAENEILVKELLK